ncbi:MAG: hypothetical protein NTZ24_08910 [Deltaproteobacteria bacterium]|nr:hypothetical protein [Deltaproteobacteria bacterium]
MKSLSVGRKDFLADKGNAMTYGWVIRGKTILCFIVWVVAFNFLIDGHALTTEQILSLRKAGVSDKTIQIMLQQDGEATSSPESGMGQKEVRDGQGNAAIVYSTGRSRSSDIGKEEKQKVEKAWEMLQHLMIDRRGGCSK